MTLSKTRAWFFPFDLFGSSGTSAGAQLLADALREMLADNRSEQQPTRARVYQNQVTVREVPFDTLDAYQDWRKTARKIIRRVFREEEFLLWVSGNHLGTLPVFDELARLNNETLVIQFDAHLDVYNLSDTTEELSHGNFLMHCDGKLPPMIHLGNRELVLSSNHAKNYFRTVISAEEIHLQPEKVCQRLRQLTRKAANVFLDVDCDVFDPTYFPALAHPQPFGLSSQQMLRLLDAVWSDRILGISLSEFDSARDVDDRSLSLLVWLMEYLLLKRYEK